MLIMVLFDHGISYSSVLCNQPRLNGTMSCTLDGDASNIELEVLSKLAVLTSRATLLTQTGTAIENKSKRPIVYFFIL